MAALRERDVDTNGFIAKGYGESQPIADNATIEGKAKNRRVEFRPISAAAHNDQATSCSQDRTSWRNINLQANDQGITAQGDMQREQYDCVRDVWSIFEAAFTATKTDNDQSSKSLDVTYRREWFANTDTVRGYFLGLYRSQNDVTRLATGDIHGLGVNGGLYQANRLKNGLLLDYYVAAAAGRHKFDLAFDRALGTVNADGSYRYLAGFAGLAVSGQTTIGKVALQPRVGLDYTYSPGTDVDVTAELMGIEQSDTLKMGSVAGGRIFAELRAERPIFDHDANLALTPRFGCYQSLAGVNGACTIGGTIEVSRESDKHDLTYAILLDGEFGDNFRQGRITARVSQHLRYGKLSADIAQSHTGDAQIGVGMTLDF